MTIPSDKAEGSQDASRQVSGATIARSAEAPCLASLRLTNEDFEALMRAGSVQPEYRRRRCVYKLRFRRGSKQVVRYIGSEWKAMQVREELGRLQALHRNNLRLLRVTRMARKRLRESKRALEPHLANCGYRYHGLAIRKSFNHAIEGPESTIAKGADPDSVGSSIFDEEICDG